MVGQGEGRDRPGTGRMFPMGKSGDAGQVTEARPAEAGKGADRRRKWMGMLHQSFEVTILLKGLHALLEIVGAALLGFANPAALGRWVVLLTQGELAEDPHDPMVRWILALSAHYSVSSQHFGVIYLLSHGLIKIVLVLLLWRRQLWSYPLAILVLFAFIAFQTVRWTRTHAWPLILLSLFDGVMIVLTWAEFHRIRREEGNP